jgi:hypothetical protein
MVTVAVALALLSIVGKSICVVHIVLGILLFITTFGVHIISGLGATLFVAVRDLSLVVVVAVLPVAVLLVRFLPAVLLRVLQLSIITQGFIQIGVRDGP